MERRRTYILKESELRNIIKEAVNAVIVENATNEFVPPGVGGALLSRTIANDFEKGNGIGGISFGIVKGRLNKQKIAQYINDFYSLYEKITFIEKELSARSQRMKNFIDSVPEPIDMNAVKASLAQQQNMTNMKFPASSTAVKAPLQPRYTGTVNEGVPAGSLIKGLSKATPTATKVVGGAYLAAYPLYRFSIPTSVAYAIANLRHPDDVTAAKLLGYYDSLSKWVIEICKFLKEHTEILGSYAIPDELLSGAKNPDHSIMPAVRNTLVIATSIGLSFAGPIGWIYDAAVFVGDLVSSKAEDDEQMLRVVEEEKKYLTSAINHFNSVLANSKTKGVSATNNMH